MKIASRQRRSGRVREQQSRYAISLPGPLYCDTSALAKLYLREPGSNEFNAVVEGRADIIVSELTMTELVSVLARLSRQGVIAREVVGRIQHAVAGRVDDGTYQRVEMTRETHRRAEHLLLHLTQTPLRAADALHLAMAMAARAPSLASFDSRLAQAARAVGLVTYPS